MRADIFVFDPATIADVATFEKPHQYAAGVKHVWVNGKATLLDAMMTGGAGGVVLRGPAFLRR